MFAPKAKAYQGSSHWHWYKYFFLKYKLKLNTKKTNTKQRCNNCISHKKDKYEKEHKVNTVIKHLTAELGHWFTACMCESPLHNKTLWC
jgi:hypothetical protein